MALKADLVVIGAGAAGLSAALTAAENGLSVILLEKETEAGGSSILSGGSITLAGTDIQEAKGITDTPSSLFDDIRRVGKNENQPEIVRAYTENQLETYEWMVANGAKFAASVGPAEGSTVLRKHSISPAEFLPVLLQKVLDTGLVKIIYSARAYMLVRDIETQRVVGVEVDGIESFTAHGRKGVILTSGGFARAADLLGRFSPKYRNVKSSAGPGNTGDGLLMSWQLGADIIDSAFIQGNYGVHPEHESLVVLPILLGAITINKMGNRYVDESISYKLHADACMALPDGISYQVFDHKVLESENPNIPVLTLKSRIKHGDIIEGDSVADLAQKIGVPVANLEHTFERYNGFVESGEDLDFGRTKTSHGPMGKALVKLDTAPFYAYKSSVILLGTYCGIRVDDKMNVLDVFGFEIDGLYAAGEIVGGLHGAGEIPGTALGKAFVFGRLAARSAIAS